VHSTSLHDCTKVTQHLNAAELNVLRNINRAVVSIIAAFISTPITWWLLSEGVVLYEMHATGTISRTELADDFGLGILLIFIVPASTLLFAIIVAVVVWRQLGKRKSVDHGKAA